MARMLTPYLARSPEDLTGVLIKSELRISSISAMPISSNFNLLLSMESVSSGVFRLIITAPKSRAKRSTSSNSPIT